ncbi:hypothetical protein [Mycoplasmoides pirum]|uniref:hypothetical protein n=1 Tax=Mycoplasmoides pirum TaxID=2122 RepID=UPI000486690D|nr:hypothetical protein [Mycoplasmoides pirum]
MDKKIKSIFNDSSNNMWSFEDYKVNDDIKFKILCYFLDKKILIGYMFANDLVFFEKIIYQLLQNQKPNNFVDFYYIYVTNEKILDEVKDIITNLPLPKDDIKNIGLFYYDSTNDEVIEIIPSVQNDSYLYKNYIKPTEIKKLEIIKNVTQKENDFLPSNLNNVSDDKNDFELNEFKIDENPLIESFNDYNESLNVTQELLNDFQENITWDIDNLSESQLVEDESSLDNNDLHNDLLEKSDYFRTLDEITKNLSDEDVLSGTKEILDYLNDKID